MVKPNTNKIGWPKGGNYYSRLPVYNVGNIWEMLFSDKYVFFFFCRNLWWYILCFVNTFVLNADDVNFLNSHLQSNTGGRLIRLHLACMRNVLQPYIMYDKWSFSEKNIIGHILTWILTTHYITNITSTLRGSCQFDLLVELEALHNHPW